MPGLQLGYTGLGVGDWGWGIQKTSPTPPKKKKKKEKKSGRPDNGRAAVLGTVADQGNEKSEQCL